MAAHDDLFGDSTLQLKLALVALVLILTGVHVWRPRWHALQGAILLASLVIIWLGLQLTR
jgi:hypothetical protein